MKSEIYISVDIETDGPIPGDNSMLSLGAAAFDAEGRLLDTFSANLEPLPHASGDYQTMKWWEANPEAYTAATADQREPIEVLQSFCVWIARQLPDKNTKPVFVAYPAGFDFLFVYWYLIHFIGSSPFSFSALDIKTYAMAKMNSQGWDYGYRESHKKNWPKEWKNKKHKHTHKAVEDAIEQGYQFFAMRNG